MNAGLALTVRPIQREPSPVTMTRGCAGMGFCVIYR